MSRRKGTKKPRKYSTKFPKRAKPAKKLKSDLKKWQKSVKAPKVPKVSDRKIKAVRLKSKHVTQLRQIHESPAATAEIVDQKMTPDQVLGVMYSSLTTYEYYKLKAEYKKRLSRTKSPKTKAKIRKQWKDIIKSAQRSYTAGGLTRVTPKDLDDFAAELKRSKNNFNAVVNIANSAELTKVTTPTRVTSVSGAFVPQVGSTIDPAMNAGTFAADICASPISGSFTKHISRSFEMKTRLYVWCPTWWQPWRWCWKTFVLAGVSFSVGLDVGYRVSCCGASAWGNAWAEACGTIIGIRICASCRASVNGVAGIGRTSSSGGDCSYGLGLTAQLSCTLAGIPVFAFAYSFGYTITGPCPPPSLPC
jgi:hypothetical protein